MCFNVVIHEDEEYINDNNYLVFHFGEDLEKAKKFSEQILKISNYYVEIIPILKEKKED